MTSGSDAIRESVAVARSATGQTEVGYLSLANEQLYYVLERPKAAPRARILLAGPFASERPHRYMCWVRWARHLVARGFEVLRFDHRGVGESTGEFELMGFDTWLEDLRVCARWLRARGGDLPLGLHGLGMGGLLASRVFDEGIGDACLLWLAPRSGREMLHEQIRLRLANDYALGAPRKSREQYFAEIETGGAIEVEGYFWTQRLVQEASALVLSGQAAPPDAAGRSRPRESAVLEPVAAHMFGGVGPNPLRAPGQQSMRLVCPDLSECFNANATWFEGALAPPLAREAVS